MTEWVATAIGVIGGIGGIGTILYWRQNKGSATAGVVRESMDALKSALETLTSQQEVFTSQQEVFAVTVKSKDEEIVVLKDQIKELKLRVAENERKVMGMQKVIENEFRERKIAEHNICFVNECKLREPALGTHKKEIA